MTISFTKNIIKSGVLTTFLFWGASTALIAQSSMSLAGQWKIKLDRENVGVNQRWQSDTFPETIQFPGSIQNQGFGNDPSVDTKWIASNADKFLMKDKYAPYRSKDTYKFPYWLTPKKHYTGVTWFQKNIIIPTNWKSKHITLELERAHWGTTIYVDGKQAGADSSLSTPHRYNLSSELTPGQHTMTIRVDNNLLYQVGINAHSVTDHTQTNWNGIVGKLRLNAGSPLYISNVQIYPDVENKKANVEVYLHNQSGKARSGNIAIQAKSLNADTNLTLPSLKKYFSVDKKKKLEFTYSMGKDPKLWDEFNPTFYTMNISINSDKEYSDSRKINFGMRSFKTKDKHFTINGRPIFLRGTLNCAIYPKTGYPPTTKSEWTREFEIVKQHGLNHVRFHSWCPPEAAFDAADELGIYLQVEAPLWANQGSSIGDNRPLDHYLANESNRIIKEYGNHPSFVMFASGNEPAGDNKEAFLGKFVTKWKQKDNRHVYTSAAGWPKIPENEYDLTPKPRIQRWGEGLNSVINGQPPSTNYNFSDIIKKHQHAVVGHEIGQWCVYPNFNEMPKYTGYLYPTNYEIFKDFLRQNNMLWQADDFFMASGKLQAICYKADIEAALRTPNYAGYQMLGLQDFPGQGTALVGILDSFWDSKPYINSKEFRRYSNSTVPLAVMEKRNWTNNETFNANLQIAHFGSKKQKNVPLQWTIRRDGHQVIAKGKHQVALPIRNNIQAGKVSLDLSSIKKAQKLNLQVQVGSQGNTFTNDWDFWVYPQKLHTSNKDDLIITDHLNSATTKKLKGGASVLLKLNGKLKEGKGKNVMAGFSSIFWNTAWTDGQAPQTLGVLVDPENPLFHDFPTDYYTNWQWWDIVHDVHPMILDDFPAGLTPSIQMIDTWFDAHKLGLLFEAKVGQGKLVVTSIDFDKHLDNRLAARQLYSSITNYMGSSDFDPRVSIEPRLIRRLYN